MSSIVVSSGSGSGESPAYGSVGPPDGGGLLAGGVGWPVGTVVCGLGWPVVVGWLDPFWPDVIGDPLVVGCPVVLGWPPHAPLTNARTSRATAPLASAMRELYALTRRLAAPSCRREA